MSHDMIQVRSSVKDALRAEKDFLSFGKKNVSYSELLELLLSVYYQYQKETEQEKVI